MCYYTSLHHISLSVSTPLSSFEIGFLCVAGIRSVDQAGLELPAQLRLPLGFSFSCLCLLNTALL